MIEIGFVYEILITFQLDPLVVSELSCWLSEEMPSRMKIIMSCSEASEDTSVFQIIKASLKHEDAFISVI